MTSRSARLCGGIGLSVLLCACNSAVDPLESFRALNAKCETRLKIPVDEVTASKSGGWTRIRHVVDYSYDVKKSDSLVNPYTAYVDVYIDSFTASKTSEAEVRATVFPRDAVLKIEDHWRVDYGFTEGAWKVLKVGNSNKVRMLDDAQRARLAAPLQSSTYLAFATQASALTDCAPGGNLP